MFSSNLSYNILVSIAYLLVIITHRSTCSATTKMTNDPLDAMKAHWSHIQSSLFPWLREEVEPMTELLGRLNDKDGPSPPPTSASPPVGAEPQRKRGRPRKGEERPKPEPTRLERQTTQNVPQMLADLPTACDVGAKKNSKGYKETWIGYKLHIDVASGQIPVACVLTSASVHDSQVAIPLMTMTSARVSYLYDLMDAAYDAVAIGAQSVALGHVPLIDRNFRAQHEAKTECAEEVARMKFIHLPDPDDVLYDFRTMVKRINGRLKDEFGGRFVRVRGAVKVKRHLMFGILALTVDQIFRVGPFTPTSA